MTGYLTVLLDGNDVADAHGRTVKIHRFLQVELLIQRFQLLHGAAGTVQRGGVDHVIIVSVHSQIVRLQPVQIHKPHILRIVPAHLINGKAAALMGKKCLLSFHLPFLSFQHLFMERRTLLPFLVFHTEKPAMLHDFLGVKHHALRVIFMEKIDGQTGSVQFQRPFSGDRQHPVIEIAVFLHIRNRYFAVGHGVLIQRLFLSIRQLGGASFCALLADLFLHLLAGGILQGLNYRQRGILNRRIFQFQPLTNLLDSGGTGQFRGIQLAAVQFFHGFLVIEGIVPASIARLNMQIGGIVQKKQGFLRYIRLFRLLFGGQVNAALLTDFLIVAFNVVNQLTGSLVDGLQTGSQLLQFLALGPGSDVTETVFPGLDAEILADCIGNAFCFDFLCATVFFLFLQKLREGKHTAVKIQSVLICKIQPAFF